MNAFWALVATHIRLHLLNRRALIVGLIVPIAIATFFGSIFSGASESPSRVPVAVIDLDASPLSQAVVAGLRGDPALALQTPSNTEALALVRSGKLRAAITLPAGFGQAAPGALFARGTKPEIRVDYDPSQAIALGLVRGILTQHVMQAVFTQGFSGVQGQQQLQTMLAQLDANPDIPADRRQSLQQLMHAASTLQQPRAASDAIAKAESASAPASSATGFSLVPFTLQSHAEVSPTEANYNGYAHSFGGMGVQFLMFMGIDLGVALLMARRLGLWSRLRAAPLSRATLLGSHAVSGTLIATVNLALVMLVAMVVFKVRINGSVLGFAALLVCIGLLTATFGLMLAAIGRSPEATRGLAMLVVLMMVMLSGAWVPTFVFPEWLQHYTVLIPLRWAVDGLDAMTWRGLGLQAALMPMAVLLGFSALFAGVAWWRFAWRE